MLRLVQISVALTVVYYVYPLFMNFVNTMHTVHLALAQ